MFKYLKVVNVIISTAILYQYLVSGILPHKIVISLWGILFISSELMSFIRGIMLESLQKKAVKRYKEITEPINNNINLTEEQKQDMLSEVLANELANTLNELQGEKK
jgi:hypothetical protein